MDFMNPTYAGCRKPETGCGGARMGGCSAREGRGASCGRDSWALSDYPLAMVYSPYQTFCDLYDAKVALKQGTLFKGLDLPFEGKGNGSCGKGCCK